MPSTLSYPGVYIEEIPSGVRTITGVATSITAFIGTAPMGLVNIAVPVTSFAEYERLFGGISPDSPLSYAVNDFYLNGGSQAIIVRVAGTGNAKGKVTLGDLILEGTTEGKWANQLRARIEPLSGSDAENDAIAKLIGPSLTHSDLFNLIIFNTVTRQSERFNNVTMKDSSRRIDRVLFDQSALVRVSGALDTTKPVPAISDGNLIDADVWTDAANKKSKPLQSGDDGSPPDPSAYKAGLHALDHVDLFNILAILPAQLGKDASDIWSDAAAYCESRRAFLIIDPQQGWTKTTATSDIASRSKNAAVYFPLIERVDPSNPLNKIGFVPSGLIAGVMARTDSERGVWKAPAGQDARLVGVDKLQVPLNDLENGALNIKGVNCLRSFPAAGRVVWGARTLQGDDRLASEWKYIPVRRLALYIEESLYRGTQWVVFEPNDEPLWSQIRLNVGAFMNNLFRQGAFQGITPRDAYFVKCDKESTTQNDINLGIVNIVVGFAPLKPAEFVVIKLQQMAGQVAA